MKALLTADTVAASLGVHRTTVIRMAHRLGLGVRAGRNIGFTPGDIDKMRPFVRSPGNPNFLPGNYFGKPRKKSRK